ncbi:hypothetical protein A3197_17090 [Candidatus Thiodiazotropha endoloripes]|nr:hypothetical protein A3197_17090 [Candidatus Thiodiazotropha endoloripes]
MLKILLVLVGHALQVLHRATPDIPTTSMTTGEHRGRDIDLVTVIMASNSTDQTHESEHLVTGIILIKSLVKHNEIDSHAAVDSNHRDLLEAVESPMGDHPCG